MTFATKNKELLDLFHLSGKPVPHEDSNMGRAVSILQTICDNHSHSIPEFENADVPEFAENLADECAEIFDALDELESMIAEGLDDNEFKFDGNEYRLIKSDEDVIWPIYRDAIQNLVEDCYSDVLKLDDIPSFIAVSVDWEQTAKNAYADGYGHQFSSYDGSEYEAGGYYIFRTN